jgi:hypothetical protein
MIDTTTFRPYRKWLICLMLLAFLGMWTKGCVEWYAAGGSWAPNGDGTEPLGHDFAYEVVNSETRYIVQKTNKTRDHVVPARVEYFNYNKTGIVVKRAFSRFAFDNDALWYCNQRDSTHHYSIEEKIRSPFFRRMYDSLYTVEMRLSEHDEKVFYIIDFRDDHTHGPLYWKDYLLLKRRLGVTARLHHNEPG